MPHGTLERTAPSFMRQGPTPRAQLILYSALALFLMVADARFHVTEPLRNVVATALYPAQWLMMQPVALFGRSSAYVESLETAQAEARQARQEWLGASLRANQLDQLELENERLRQLLELRTRTQVSAKAAQILYDTADPYSRRVVVDAGQTSGVQLGSPVVDALGVLGQITRVHPFYSEATLLIDKDQAIPVLNVRTGQRGVAYGDPVLSHGGGMELRFIQASADVQEGDLLTTSGMDRVYPPGLPVARVVRVERRADLAFARVYCVPLARVQSARHVLLLSPAGGEAPQVPAAPEAPASAAKKKARP
ncbi:MAG: rod shape-determining protein MreC [Acidovorax sp. SCN 68-22]|jgi:rod shape-determining protein MreC|nr:rod shape-determining protein MreC [Simplicispira sp.]ODS70767.1 MAG: rod shape-determining protein MreC [Acidovorax sp. SCN 68-22]